MIEALRSAGEPAELGIVAVGLAALVAQGFGARRSERGLLGLALLWAAVACLVRDGRAAGPLLLDLPHEDWAGFVAVSHAVAAQVAWVGATVAAVVSGAGALWARPPEGPPPGSAAGSAAAGSAAGSAAGAADAGARADPGPARADPGPARVGPAPNGGGELAGSDGWFGLVAGRGLEGWPSLRRPGGPLPAALGVAAAILLVATFGAPQVGWTAPAFVLAALVARRSPVEAAAPASFAAAGAWFGSIAARYQVAVLARPADVERLDAAMLGSVAAGTAAVIALALAVAVGRPVVPVVVAGFGALFAGWGGLTYRPAAELVEVASILPVHRPARVARMPGGCLVEPGGSRTVGIVVEREAVLPCPADPADPAAPGDPRRGRFPAEQAPLLAVPGSAPIAALLGHHAPEVGSVRVLARLDDGWAMPAWRISAREVPVWAPIPHARVTPLPGAWLVYADDEGRVRGASAAGEADDPVERVRLGGLHRVDVLVHASAAPTVDDLLRTCASFERVHPVGLRCVLATGDLARWRRRLEPAPSPAPIEAEWETVEGDPEDGFD